MGWRGVSEVCILSDFRELSSCAPCGPCFFINPVVGFLSVYLSPKILVNCFSDDNSIFKEVEH